MLHSFLLSIFISFLNSISSFFHSFICLFYLFSFRISFCHTFLSFFLCLYFPLMHFPRNPSFPSLSIFYLLFTILFSFYTFTSFINIFVSLPVSFLSSSIFFLNVSSHCSFSLLCLLVVSWKTPALLLVDGWSSRQSWLVSFGGHSTPGIQAFSFLEV